MMKTRSYSIVIGGGGRTEIIGDEDASSGSCGGTMELGVSGFAFGRFLHL